MRRRVRAHLAAVALVAVIGPVAPAGPVAASTSVSRSVGGASVSTSVATPMVLPAGTSNSGGPPFTGNVACPGPAVCFVADGTFIERTVAGISSAMTVPPPGAGSVNLTDVSCPAISDCMATGTFTADSSDQRQMVEARYDGLRWTSEVVAPPSDPNAGLTSLTCPTITFCAALGGGSIGADDLLATWSADTDTWKFAAFGVSGSGGSSAINALSCASESLCAAVGHWPMPDSRFPEVPMVLVWDGSSWTSNYPPMPAQATPDDYEYDGDLSGVSCILTTCHAVGDSNSQYVAPPTITPIAVTVRSNGSLTSTAMPGSTHDPLQLVAANSITCPTVDWCATLNWGFPTDGLASVSILSHGIWTASTVPSIIEGQQDQTALAGRDPRLRCTAPGLCVLFGIVHGGDFGSGAYEDWLVDGTWSPSFTAVPADAASDPMVQAYVVDGCSLTPFCEELFDYLNVSGQYENAIATTPDLNVGLSSVAVAAVRSGHLAAGITRAGHTTHWRSLGGPSARSAFVVARPGTTARTFIAAGRRHELRYRSASAPWRTLTRQSPCTSAPSGSAIASLVIVACTNKRHRLALGVSVRSGARLSTMNWAIIDKRSFIGSVSTFGAGRTLHVTGVDGKGRLLDYRPGHGAKVVGRHCRSIQGSALIAGRNVAYAACVLKSGMVTEWVNRAARWTTLTTFKASKLRTVSVAATTAGPVLAATLADGSVQIHGPKGWRTLHSHVSGSVAALGLN